MKSFKQSPMTAMMKLMVIGAAGWITFIFCVPRNHPPVPIMMLFASFWAVQYLVQHILCYRVVNGWIVIHRRMWNISLPRNQLLSATHDPTAFDDLNWWYGSRGGWSYYGRFSSRRLGAFRSFVSDPRNSVVLRFSDQVIIVSPENPRAFIASLNVPADSSAAFATTSTGGGYFSGYW